MKKITALLLAALMSVSLLSSVAFAAGPMAEGSDVPTVTLDPNSFIRVKPLEYEEADLDELPEISGEENIESRAITVPRVNPIYYDVFPVIFQNGHDTAIVDDPVCIHKGPTGGLGYIDEKITAAEQNRVKAICKSLGYEVIGWYVYTAYELINVFDPGYWSFYVMRESGDSKKTIANANLGINEFGILTYIPTEPRAFKCGIKGSLVYRPQQGMDTVSMPIGLYATFEAC